MEDNSVGRFFIELVQSEKKSLELLESGFDKVLINHPRIHAIILIIISNSCDKVLERLLNSGLRVSSFYLTIALLFPGDQVNILKTLLKFATNDVLDDNFVMHVVSLAPKGPHTRTYCEMLLKRGYDVNKVTNGTTPLTVAIKEDNFDVVEILLTHGANPCQEYEGRELIDSEKMIWKDVSCTSLQFAFSLPSITIESIVKYATLHVEIEDERKLIKFYNHFKQDKARPFLNFATACVAETRILKRHTLNSNKLNLFNVVVSQKNELKLFLDDQSLKNQIFRTLVFASLPIYKTTILRKFTKIDIVNGLVECSPSKFGAYFESKEVTLNADCVYHICKLLPTEDLLLLWKAASKM